MTSAAESSGPSTDPAQAAVHRLADGLAVAGWQVTGGAPGAPWSFVARTAQFRWRWMATRMHIFVFGVPVYDGVHPEWLDTQLAAAVEYSRAAKGGLPAGFQTGTATMLVAIGSGLAPEVQSWTSRVHGRAYAAVTLPVLGDVATGQVAMPGRPVLGAVYHGYLAGVAERFVGAAVRPQPLAQPQAQPHV